MLPPFIIEQIRRREQDQARREYERPALRIPSTLPPKGTDDSEPVSEDERNRGVTIIDLG